jgi:hypothetical protein
LNISCYLFDILIKVPCYFFFKTAARQITLTLEHVKVPATGAEERRIFTVLIEIVEVARYVVERRSKQ